MSDEDHGGGDKSFSESDSDGKSLQESEETDEPDEADERDETDLRDETEDRYETDECDVSDERDKTYRTYETDQLGEREEQYETEGSESVDVLTEEDAYEALSIFVSEHCCYGKKPLQLMKIESMQSSNAFHYSLETFGESRSDKLTFAPYTGGYFGDISLMGDLWDYEAEPDAMFKKSKLTVELPNSSVIKDCHFCNGECQVTCLKCSGEGQLTCFRCSGKGYITLGDESTTCDCCSGNGVRQCTTCEGTGLKTCTDCWGTGQMRWFTLLTIKWKNHVDDVIIQSRPTDLPDENIFKVSGYLVFEEMAQQVYPVHCFHKDEIKTESETLIAQHGANYAQERIIMQRQKIHKVPVTEVIYSYKEKERTYHVYGLEHKVYAPDYPQKCCGCCTVL